MSKRNQRSYNPVFLTISVLVVALIQSAPNSVNVGMANLMAIYHQYPSTVVILLSTITSLTCLPTNLLFGVIVKRIGYKKTDALGLSLFLLGGILPFFFSNFWIILMLRAICGIGFGLAIPMGNALAVAYFKDKETRGRIIGWNGSVYNLSGMIFAMLGAVLLAFGIRYIWLANLIGIIPFVFGLTMPEPQQQEDDTEIEKSLKQSDSSDGVAGVKVSNKSHLVWLHLLLLFIVSAFNYPLFLNISSIVANEKLGNAVQAGLVITIFTIGGTVGGFVYGFVLKSMKKWTYPIGGIITAIGALILYEGKSMEIMYVGSVIAGFAWMFIMSSCYLNINLTAPSDKLSLFNGFAILANNLGLFTSIYIVNGISALCGQAGSLRFPIFQWAVVMVVSALIFAVDALNIKKAHTT